MDILLRAGKTARWVSGRAEDLRRCMHRKGMGRVGDLYILYTRLDLEA